MKLSDVCKMPFPLFYLWQILTIWKVLGNLKFSNKHQCSPIHTHITSLASDKQPFNMKIHTQIQIQIHTQIQIQIHAQIRTQIRTQIQIHTYITSVVSDEQPLNMKSLNEDASSPSSNTKDFIFVQHASSELMFCHVPLDNDENE